MEGGADGGASGICALAVCEELRGEGCGDGGPDWGAGGSFGGAGKLGSGPSEESGGGLVGAVGCVLGWWCSGGEVESLYGI